MPNTTPTRQFCCECLSTTTDYTTERTEPRFDGDWPRVWHRCSDTEACGRRIVRSQIAHGAPLTPVGTLVP